MDSIYGNNIKPNKQKIRLIFDGKCGALLPERAYFQSSSVNSKMRTQYAQMNWFSPSLFETRTFLSP